MRGFITHEAIAKEVLSRGFTSGKDKLEAWAVALTNREDDELAPALHRPVC